jgi:hypothetical protein
MAVSKTLIFRMDSTRHMFYGCRFSIKRAERV